MAKLKFDIDQEELPVFLAEADEQLQVLDDGLIHLEREGEQIELVQTLFRAAHTLKGGAGMIGHKRMVTVTHALENALDGLRKHSFSVSPLFIDLCLEAVDSLRLLRTEVITCDMTSVNVEEVASHFSNLLEPKDAHEKEIFIPAPSILKLSEKDLPGALYRVNVVITKNSIASAARAMQIIMALQEIGTIVQQAPSQEVIDSANPIEEINIIFMGQSTKESIKHTLELIGDLEEINIEPEFKKPDADGRNVFLIEALISENSIASAARALQIILALQEMGTIESSDPTQEVIDTARPVKKLKATFFSHEQVEKIQNVLNKISEIDELSIVDQSKPQDEITAELGLEKDGQKNGQLQIKQDAQKAGQASAQTRAASEKTIRTSVERLDNLMNLVGELITDRNRLYQIRGYFEGRFKGDEKVDSLSDTVAHIGRITDQLQKEVMGIRMQPVATVFNKFPRMVRDLAKKFEKNVDLIIEGEDTELDRSVIEEITDPLIHLIRNSVDHGIEMPEERIRAGKPANARILLEAHHEQGRIMLTVEDDGKGIDTDRVVKRAIEKGLLTETEASLLSIEESINLIFISGLSTTNKISDISGRGVGLDIVRNNIQRLNGSISIETSPGHGSRFQITLPLTLAIVPTLLVKIANLTFAIPLITVSTTLRITGKDIQTINKIPVTRLRDTVLPLIKLTEVFKLKSDSQDDYYHVVVVNQGKQMIGLVVNNLLGQEEVVVKSLGPLVGDIFGIASAAILGDGSVILLVDVQDLFQYNSIQ